MPNAAPVATRSTVPPNPGRNDGVAEIINLNRARKAKRRAADTAQAEANRAAFGRTRAEKAADEAERQRQTVALDGHERDR